MKPSSSRSGWFDASRREVQGGGSRRTFDLPEGTIYPARHRLERAGLLTSRWSDHTGRRRRVYQITGPGRRALEKQHADWRTFARAVADVVGAR